MCDQANSMITDLIEFDTINLEEPFLRAQIKD